MKSASLIVGLVSVLCLSLAACVTCKQSASNMVPFSCIVESETEVVYEINLDGKFVSSGKTLPLGKDMQAVELMATPGDHLVKVSAPGYGTWNREVNLMSGTKNGSSFRIDLKKAEK